MQGQLARYLAPQLPPVLLFEEATLRFMEVGRFKLGGTKGWWDCMRADMGARLQLGVTR